MDDFFRFSKKIGFLGILGIGATICIGREILCLPYAGFSIRIYSSLHYRLNKGAAIAVFTAIFLKGYSPFCRPQPQPVHSEILFQAIKAQLWSLLQAFILLLLPASRPAIGQTCKVYMKKRNSRMLQMAFKWQYLSGIFSDCFIIKNKIF